MAKGDITSPLVWQATDQGLTITATLNFSETGQRQLQSLVITRSASAPWHSFLLTGGDPGLGNPNWTATYTIAGNGTSRTVTQAELSADGFSRYGDVAHGTFA